MTTRIWVYRRPGREIFGQGVHRLAGEGINSLVLYLDDLEPLQRDVIENGDRVTIEESFIVSEERQGRFAYVQSSSSL
jgi:hypothetical protein